MRTKIIVLGLLALNMYGHASSIEPESSPVSPAHIHIEPPMYVPDLTPGSPYHARQVLLKDFIEYNLETINAYYSIYEDDVNFHAVNMCAQLIKKHYDDLERENIGEFIYYLMNMPIVYEGYISNVKCRAVEAKIRNFRKAASELSDVYDLFKLCDELIEEYNKSLKWVH